MLARLPMRKVKLGRLVRGPHPGIVLNGLYKVVSEIVFKHACTYISRAFSQRA